MVTQKLQIKLQSVPLVQNVRSSLHILPSLFFRFTGDGNNLFLAWKDDISGLLKTSDNHFKHSALI